MNQGIYRLIFNTAKGLIEVAGELASNGGKGGKINSPASTVSTQKRAGLCVGLKPLVFASLIATGQVWSPAALAQIAVDGSVQQQTSVSTTANGIPQVNINAASSGGVSRNTFTQFDVDRQGVILNNAISNTATQQAGFVAANPNLVGGQARVILNEVNSTQQSILNGFLEVAGQRADVIVANPAGITCSGCGFINVNRGTLTTGDPTFTNGELSGFRVNGGEITIGRDGLDSSGTDFTDVIARSVKVNGAIVANTLGITTGRNQVNTDNTQHTALADDGSDKPEFSIDVAALGGMYAGQIHLIGTEQGVGVRNAGSIGASAGEFTLSSDGGLINTNSMTSTGNTTIAIEGDLDNQGTIHSTSNSQVASAADVINSGSLSSTGDFTLIAEGDITQGTDAGLGAGVNAQSQIDATTNATLAISAGGKLNLQGNQVASGDLNLTATEITLVSAEQQADNTTLIATSGDIKLTDTTLLINNQTTITAAQTVALNNTDSASTQLTINANDLTIDGDSTLAQTDSNINVNGTVTNRGDIDSQNTIDIDTQTLTNTGTGRIFGDDIIIEANTLNNTASDGAAAAIAARESLNIGINALNNNNDALLYSDGDLTIGGSIVNGQAIGRANTITNDQARIEAAEDILITANTINNLNDDLVIETEEVVETNQRAFQLFDSVNFIDGTLSNGGSLLNVAGGGNTSSFQTFNFTRTTTRNVLGVSDTLAVISAEGNITLDSTNTITNQNSQITAGGALGITSNNLVNSQDTGTERISEQGTFTETRGGNTSGSFSFSGPDNLARTARRSETTTTSNGGEDGGTTTSNGGGEDGGGGTTTTTTTNNFTVLITDNSTDRVSNDESIRTTGNDRVTTITLESGLDRSGQSSNQGLTIPEGGAQITAITQGDNGEVRVLNLTPALPTNSLFNQNPAATAPFLIETDRRFTNGNNFISSAFFLMQLGLDPADQQKRLGDGFFEQRLVRDQLITLTGQRFLEGYSDNEAQYHALLTNGAAFAQDYNIIPGVALSADQIGLLTTDVVLLVSQKVTLADGSAQSVLVPRVYALVQAGNITGGGNLISGQQVAINSNDVKNSGAIAGDQLSITTDTLTDTLGRVEADNLDINASGDIRLSGSNYRVTDSASLRAQSDIVLDKNSTITKTQGQSITSDTGTVVLDAGQNLTVRDSQITNEGTGDTQLNAGNNLTIDTAKSIQKGSRVQGAGDVSLSAGDNITLEAATVAAGNDLNLNAESIAINASEEKRSYQDFSTSRASTRTDSTSSTGSQLSAGNNVTVDAEEALIITGSTIDANNNLTLNAKSTTIVSSEDKLLIESISGASLSSTTHTGSELKAGNNVTVNAEEQLAITGSRIDTGNDLNLNAESVTITASANRHLDINDSNNSNTSTNHTGSQLSAGNNVTVSAADTLAIAGSGISAENDLSLNAESIDIVASKDTSSRRSRGSHTVVSYGGEDGASSETTTTTTTRISQISHVGSQLSAGNTVAITANDKLTVTGSQINADQDVNLEGNDVTITAATNKATINKTGGGSSRDFSNSSSETQTSSTLTAAKSINVNAADDIAITGSNLDANNSITLNAGDDIAITTAESNTRSKSREGRTRRSSNNLTNTTSNLNAANDVSLTAGNDISLKGTNVDAGQDIALTSGGDTHISVAQNEAYTYYKKTKKKSFGRKKTTIKETFKTKNIGGDLIAGNNITVNAEIGDEGTITGSNNGDVLIRGADISAENNVAISGDNVTIANQKEINFKRKETFKRGFGGLSSKSTGRISREEILRGTSINADQQDLSLVSASDIAIIASNISSGGDVNLQAIDDIIITADQALSQAQTWSKETKFLSSLSSVYERTDKMSGSTTSTVVGSDVNAGGNVTINSGRARVVGSDITAGNNINVTTDIGDIVVESAQSTSESFSNETTVKIGFSDVLEQLVDVKALADSLGDGQAKLSIAKATYDKVDTQTTATTHRASQLVANNNLALDSVGDIAITGSDLIADADNNQQGDTTLVAGGDVTIKETADVSDTQTDEVHGKGEVSVVVQHQAVEIAKAAESVKDAKDQVKQAKEDYRKYEKDLANLKTQRDQLQTDYNNKEPGLLYEDIVDLNSLIDEVESDKDWYQAGIALAAANLVSKSTLLYQQIAAGIASVGTWGFNAGIQIDLEASKTKTKSHSEISRGSVLAGNNITLQTGNNSDITQTATTITGSQLQAKQDINIATGDLTIEASKDDNSFNTKTEQASIRIAQTVYGAAGGPTISADYSRSKAKSGDTTYNNSSLNADNISLSSTADTTIKGANIKAEDTLTLDVGNNLHVQSQQNRYSANNKSAGISAGFSLGKGGTGDSKTVSGAAQNIGKHSGEVSSVSGGLNASSGRTRTKQTVLTDLIGNTVNITTNNRTALIGATVAAKDTDGNDNGQLTLSTKSFDFADLSNTRYDSQRSAGISANVGINDKVLTKEQKAAQINDPTKNSAINAKGEKEGRLNAPSIAYSNNSSYAKSKTLATLGEGAVTIADDQATGDDSTERLNRDTDNTTKELYSIDRQQGNVDLTVDTRLLSVKGREEIAKEIVVTGTVVQSVSKVVPDAERGGVLGGVGIFINALGVVTLGVIPSDANHGGIIAQLPVLLGQGDQHHEVINGDAKRIFINGVNNTLNQAKESAKNIIGEDVEHGNWYNPTHGILSDLLEAGTDLLGNILGYQTGVSKQNEAYQAANRDKIFYPHSQGHLISQQGASNPDITNGHTFNSYGAPPTLGTSHAPFSGVDKIFADDENREIEPHKNDGDFVAKPLNILNPKNWFKKGHGTKYYGAAAGQPTVAPNPNPQVKNDDPQ